MHSMYVCNDICLQSQYKTLNIAFALMEKRYNFLHDNLFD